MRRPAAVPTRRQAAAPMRRPPAAEPPAPSIEKWAEMLGLGLELEAHSYVNIVYLCTIWRVLASTLMGRPDLRDIGTITREQVRDALIDAFNNPDASIYGGRPRAGDGGHLVEKIIVVKEEHKDGTFHFHVGISFTLQLPAHASGCLVLPWAEKLTRQSPGCCVRPEQRADTFCVSTFGVFEWVLSIARVTSLGSNRTVGNPTD